MERQEDGQNIANSDKVFWHGHKKVAIKVTCIKSLIIFLIRRWPKRKEIVEKLVWFHQQVHRLPLRVCTALCYVHNALPLYIWPCKLTLQGPQRERCTLHFFPNVTFSRLQTWINVLTKWRSQINGMVSESLDPA